MHIDPRKEILVTWEAVARFSFHKGVFVASGTDDSDSIADAEQLLCVMLPVASVQGLHLERPADVDSDAIRALASIGEQASLPIRLARSLRDHFLRHTDPSGAPTFRAGRYLDTPDPAVAGLDLVESFALGVRLSLAAIGFAKVLRHSLTRSDDLTELIRLEDVAHRRLGAAMIGLLRSFAVHAFDTDAPEGRHLRDLIHQEHRDERAVLRELDDEFAPLRAAMREIFIGSSAGLVIPEQTLFSCGWTWGVIADAPDVEVETDGLTQREGTAAATPHPYFTDVAMRAVRDLLARRTRLLGLLDEEEQRLARALQLRYELARGYWGSVATFGDHRWTLDHMPWRTTDGSESDHHTVAVASVTIDHLAGRWGNTDLQFGHLTRVLAGLARRHRIVRHPAFDQEQRSLSSEPIQLAPGVTYAATALLPQLFRSVVQAATSTENEQLRTDLENLASRCWEHLTQGAPVDLKALGDKPSPNWHNILCTVESLAAAANLGTRSENGRARTAMELLHTLIADAEAMYDSLPDLAAPDADRAASVADWLARAKQLADTQPGRATALLYRCLDILEDLTE